ncbi:MAG: hypothetical protein HOI66_19425 [Verrucomicrobia bacterium]|nr:hypothetical protein [Verrucomicrobiota bacterium]
MKSFFLHTCSVLFLGLFLAACSDSTSSGSSERLSRPEAKRPVLVADANGPVTVVLSEFCAANDSVLQDRDGDYSDWIELHNYGVDTVQLNGCYLTDDSEVPNKWAFPDLVMASGEYLIVFASGKDEYSEIEFHTNFGLSAQGDYLALIGRDGQAVVDRFGDSFPKQRNDVSFGLAPGWTSEEVAEGFHGFLLHPTPGHANSEPLIGDVATIKFSQERGFFDEAFELSLSCRTEDASIRYTLDGSRPSLENGLLYTGPIPIDRTTVIKVGGFKEQYRPARVKTNSFVFPFDVARQSLDGLPPAGFPFLWGSNRLDYGMDPIVVDDPRYREELIVGLKSLPSFSVVMDLDDMFDSQNGIYANPQQDGRGWERPCSVEYLLSDGTEGFQIDCGIRIRGGFSRSPSNPKHALRFFFRDVYGPSKLEYPLFGEEGAQAFDNLDLRTFQNYSWSMSGDPRAVFMRDQFNRDLQASLDQPSARGEYCHLYINGHYWGLYDTCERPEASYGATYFGGKKANFDVIKRGDGEGGLAITATDGNLDAWRRLWEQARAGLESDEAYQRLLGRQADGSLSEKDEVLLDPENLIDYMFVIFYGGNLDAPISRFMGNERPNNWYGIRNRKGNAGFRFFVWDAEHTLLEIDEDRTGPFPAGNDFGTSNPQWIWQQCLDNVEFRMLVADLAYKRFYNDGALSARSVRKRFQARAKQIESAVICESARWGDSSGRSGSMNRDDHWRPEMRRIADDYIPKRSDVVLGQLFRHGLIPDFDPPKMSRSNGDVKAGTTLELSVSRGRIYYTTDGSDPRTVGGEIHSRALEYSESLVLERDLDVRARTWIDGEWSALAEGTFSVKAVL